MNAFTLLLTVFLCTLAPAAERSLPGPEFYSAQGRERKVSFQGSFRSEIQSLQEIETMTNEQKLSFKRYQLEPTLKYLFGPLTHRSLGGPQRGSETAIDWNSASLIDGKIVLNYDYQGVWIVNKDAPEKFDIPVPLNKKLLLTPAWTNCTDSDPEHQTEWFYWYFWDPNRYGCDHKPGVQYQTVTVQLGAETVNETQSYPEYEKLLQSTGQNNRYQLTFAFGYVKDPTDPNPDTDGDAGIYEYRNFINYVRQSLRSNFTESKILQNEYRNSRQPTKAIGRRFKGKINGVDIVINAVAAAGIDQMEIFAKSFAHDHDGFFGWFGHSRVGSGFDADRFGQIMAGSPDYYSVTKNYQVIYWGGCNSYSYYTLPFFEFKTRANPSDRFGTKGLDIIVNGLPSYFSLNADNAATAFKYFMNWEKNPSFQTIINELERSAQGSGIDALVAVLGDEDNRY